MVVGVWAITGVLLPAWAIIGVATNARSNSSGGSLFLASAVTLAGVAALALAIGLGARMGATRAAEVGAFWRSRAIGVDDYFWPQIGVELLGLLFLAVWPALLAQAAQWWWPFGIDSGTQTYLRFGAEAAADVEQVLLVQIVFMYGLGVMVGAITRNGIVGAMVTIGLGAAWGTGLDVVVHSKMPMGIGAGLAPTGYGVLVLAAAAVALMIARLFFEYRLWGRGAGGE